VINFDHHWGDAGDSGTVAFTAVIFDEAKYCAVVDPTSPTNSMRGDQFEPQLREAIEEYDNSMAYDESTNPGNGWNAPDESIFPIRQRNRLGGNIA
jgi:hypothetical protein